MRYINFVISNYRAIRNPLHVNVGRQSLMPIIGVNESGKTTILHAIFAFDWYNDNLNDGRHLSDLSNLYETEITTPTVSADIELTLEDLNSTFRTIDEANTEAVDPPALEEVQRNFSGRITITRDLSTLNYIVPALGQLAPEIVNKLARKLIGRLPYILYFDDFRDSIDEKVEIVKDADGKVSGWLAILEELFKQTDPSFSVFNLASMEERHRLTVLSRVNQKLNATLTREWQNFRLDDVGALEISIKYDEEGAAGSKRDYLKMHVIEKDPAGVEYHFYIRDRSKGFYWFFNFVMKLEFNPKVMQSSGIRAIYLLDEPGSYLHASAQRKLCNKLKQLSEQNVVIYCTHSHYLLDPATIPFSSVYVADKGDRGAIELVPMSRYRGSIQSNRAAFQPIIDALQIKPFVLDLNPRKIIITEGICDYYALEIFKSDANVNILPSVGANSILYFISLMIAWQIPYKALWDNDDEGRKAYHKAVEYFGEHEADGHFFLLPKTGTSKNRILQNMFAGSDLKMIRTELGLPLRAHFDKTLTSLFYSPNRDTLVNDISLETKSNFRTLFVILSEWSKTA